MSSYIKNLGYKEEEIESKWVEFCQRHKNEFNALIALQNLVDLTRILKESGMDVFAVYGSLLGLIRNGQLIYYDTDVDVGYFNLDLKKLELSHSDLCENGFQLLRTRDNDNLITYGRNGNYIDLYRFDFVNELPISRGLAIYFPKKSLLPLDKIKTLYGQVNIPNKSVKILLSLYGRDWRKEKRNIHYPANKFSIRILKFFQRIIVFLFGQIK